MSALATPAFSQDWEYYFQKEKSLYPEQLIELSDQSIVIGYIESLIGDTNTSSSLLHLDMDGTFMDSLNVTYLFPSHHFYMRQITEIDNAIFLMGELRDSLNLTYPGILKLDHQFNLIWDTIIKTYPGSYFDFISSYLDSGYLISGYNPFASFHYNTIWKTDSLFNILSMYTHSSQIGRASCRERV